MKKVGIITIVVIVLVLIIVGVILLYKKYLRGNIMDGPGMINETFTLKKIMDEDIKHGTLLAIRYSNSGDMNGNINSTELLKQDDGTYILRTRYAQGHWEKIKCRDYNVSDEEVKELVDMINKYNFTEWNKLDGEELYILDGPQRSLSFTYDESEYGGSKYKTYGVTIEKIFSDDNATKVLREFEEKLFSLSKEEKLIKEYTEE